MRTHHEDGDPKHWLDFLAIIGLIVISGAVAVYILDNQRLKLPGVGAGRRQGLLRRQGRDEHRPGRHAGPGPDREHRRRPGRRDLEGRAQGGQGASSRCGWSRATAASTRTRRCCCARRPASRTWSPSSSRARRSAGRLKDGGVIPVSQTLPDVNLDEVLASLDGDTRDYLTVLLGAGAEGLRGNGRELANALRRIEPSARYGRKVFASLAKRRQNIKRVIHNLSLIMEELGAKDDQLAEFVENSNAVFATLAAPGREPARDAVRAALRARRDPARARQGQDAGRRARPDAAGAAARRSRARPDAAAGAPVRARDDADAARRDPAVRARLAPDGAASCSPRCATSPPRRPTSSARSRSSTSCSTRWPTTRRARRRATCSGSPGPTTSATSSSRPRTRTARSAAASSSPPARTCRCSTRSSSPTRCWAC